MTRRTAGQPFVGPAGRLLVKAIDEAGIDRAVRIARTPSSISGSPRPYTEAPHRSDAGHAAHHGVPAVARRGNRPVGPEVIVCLGATATKALLGSAIRVTKDRGDSWNGRPAWDRASSS